MQQVELNYFICLLWLLFHLNVARETGNAELSIKFIRYENKDAKLADGVFCETDFTGMRLADCDPIFKFEVMREGGNGEALFSYKQTDHFSRGTVFKFGTVIDNMVNPISFDVKMDDPAHIYLIVTVDDYDPSGKNKPMDIFAHMLAPSQTAQYANLVSPSTKHRLAINYRFICKTNFYGSLCNKNCVEMNDDTNGHYSCSKDGEKVGPMSKATVKSLRGAFGADADR
uniref:DSL domain-containing protein n=1 Tax=Macrostomum lignano TaxID=282301 RepID=A0A1I8HBA7_9PLAT